MSVLNVGYCKPFINYNDQLQRLINRGLIVNDQAKALEILKNTNYYRFTAYTLTLKKNDKFYPGVSFDEVYQLYLFDDALRKVMLKYLSYVEITFRSYVAYYMAGTHGELSYMYPSYFNNTVYHAQFLNELTSDIDRSDDLFVDHHRNKYNSVFPIWVVTEVMSFGVLSKMFSNMLPSDKQSLSKRFYNVSSAYIQNWVHCCVYCRNIAAHGGRFYNRELRSVPVKLPNKYTHIFSQTRCFAFIYAIISLLPDKKSKKGFIRDIENLFATYPFVKLKHIGFPANWKCILLSQVTIQGLAKCSKKRDAVIICATFTNFTVSL